MDLEATPTSVHRKPRAGVHAQEPLPVYFRHHTHRCAGIDVFTQDARHTPDSRPQCSGFCIPSINTVCVVFKHLEESKAQAVVFVPDKKLPWLSDCECHGDIQKVLRPGRGNRGYASVSRFKRSHEGSRADFTAKKINQDHSHSVVTFNNFVQRTVFIFICICPGTTGAVYAA